MATTRKKKKKKQAKPTEDNTNLEQIRLWQERVSRAKDLRKSWEDEYDVELSARFYLGKQRRPEDTESFVVNHFLSTIKTQKANVFLHRPKMFVRPKPGRGSQQEERRAAVGEGILEAIGAQENNLENAANLAITQNFWRMGVLKVTYNPKLERNPRAGEPMFMTSRDGRIVRDPRTVQPLFDEAGNPVIDPQTGQQAIDPESGEPMLMVDQNGEPIREPAEILTDEVYRYTWVDAKNMLLPDEGPDESRWTWIGEEISVPLKDAKEDTRFPKDMRDQFVANETNDRDPNVMRSRGTDIMGQTEDAQKFRYMELYDIKNKRLVVTADGQPFDDRFILDEDIPEGVEDHPYALLRIDLITDPEPNPYPLPLTQSWIDLQREYNISRTLQVEGSKRSPRKGWYTEGAFDDVDDAVSLMQSPRDMEWAKVNGKEGEMFGIFQTPDLNPGIYKNTALLQTDWPVITGQSGARLANPDANTATEASFIERAANLRDANMQKAIINWLSIAGSKMFQLVKKTLTIETWIKLRGYSDTELRQFLESEYGLTGALIDFYPGLKDIFRERFAREEAISITREELSFEADVTVAPGSTRPRNLDVERRQWIEFLTTIGQFPQLALSRELLRETAEKYEHVSERMIDELHALAQKMIQVNAVQAGRTQGGASNGAGAVEENPLAQVLAGAQNANV